MEDAAPSSTAITQLLHARRRGERDAFARLMPRVRQGCSGKYAQRPLRSGASMPRIGVFVLSGGISTRLSSLASSRKVSGCFAVDFSSESSSLSRCSLPPEVPDGSGWVLMVVSCMDGRSSPYAAEARPCVGHCQDSGTDASYVRSGSAPCCWTSTTGADHEIHQT